MASTCTAASAASPQPPPPMRASDSASSLCDVATSAIAPSALRRGRYSSFPYARCDIGGRGGEFGAAGGCGLGGGISAYVDDEEEEDGPRDAVRYSNRRRGRETRSGGRRVDDGDAAGCVGGRSADARPSAGGPAATGSVCLPLLRPAGTVGARGPILSRTSPRSLLLRRWRSAYWAHAHPARLLLFRSGEDFREWERLGPRGGAGGDGGESGSKVQQQRSKLIKWSVDFDTMGVLSKKEKKLRKERRRREKEERIRRENYDSDANSVMSKKKAKTKKKKKRRDKGADADDDEEEADDDSIDESTAASGGGSGGASKKKSRKKKRSKESKEKREEAEPPAPVVHSALKYSMEPVHSKAYHRHGPVLHTFKLERWTLDGTGVAAAFASSDPDEVRALRRIVRELIQACARERSDGAAEGDGDDDDRSAAGSPRMGTASTERRSALSGAMGAATGSVSFSDGRAVGARKLDSSSVGPVARAGDPGPAVRSQLSARDGEKCETGSALSGTSSALSRRRGGGGWGRRRFVRRR